MEKIKLEITWSSLWRIFVFGLAVWLFYVGHQVFMGIFLAVIISSGLEGIADRLERWGIPRVVAVILVFLVIVLAVILLLYAIVPLALVQLNTILSNLGAGNPAGDFFLSLKSSKSFSGAISGISSAVFSGDTTPLDFFSNALGGFGLAFAVVISSFYLSISRDGVERFIKVVTPPDYEDVTLRLYERSKRKLGSWFHMQFFLTVTMGVVVGVGLWLLHVPYAFFIGCLAGLFELVPFLGPILAGAIGVFTAASISTSLAISALVFFVIAQQFESNVLVPLLSRRSVGIHPVVAIVALLIGADVAGVLGIVIAVPAAAIFQEIIEEWSSAKRMP